MVWWDRLIGRKQMRFPIVAEVAAGQVVWPAIKWSRLVSDAYNVNAAVGACISVHAFTYPEAPPRALDRNDDPLPPTAPLAQRLMRPNPRMSFAELQIYIAVYKAVGGNCYLHKVRDRIKRVVELYPYHDGNITPIPGTKAFIEAYEFRVGSQPPVRIPPEDIIHLKWPVIDLDRPWMGLAPLRQIAREVDSDSEMSRMLYAFLKNDATMRTIVTFPPDAQVEKEDIEAVKQRLALEHGGDNRGGVAIITGGASVHRLSLDLGELDLTALRNVPEARICAGFRVPPEVAGLSVGMAHSTENNLQAADVRFTQRTLVPLWKLDAGELTADLATEFGDGLSIEYDTSEVQALQEDLNAVYTRTIEAYDKDLTTKNEARAELGLPPLKDLKRDDPEGDVFKSETTPPPLTVDAIDVVPEERQLTDEAMEEDEGEKWLELKARRRRRTDAVTVPRLQSELESILRADYNAYAENPSAAGS